MKAEVMNKNGKSSDDVWEISTTAINHAKYYPFASRERLNDS